MAANETKYLCDFNRQDVVEGARPQDVAIASRIGDDMEVTNTLDSRIRILVDNERMHVGSKASEPVMPLQHHPSINHM